MSSTTAIINRALARIGRQRITSLDDRTADADLIRELYPDIRQSIIRAHPWHWATRRLALAPGSLGDPSYGWAYRLPLPQVKAPYGAWLRTVGCWTDEAEECPAEYLQEAGAILSNDSLLYARMIHDIEDPNRMDALFREALSLKLGYELAVALNNSNTQTEVLRKEAADALLRARSVEAIEKKPVVREAGSWETAHQGARAA